MAVVGSEKLDSHNLRDFLRIKDDDRHSNLNQSTSSSGGGGGSGRHNPPGLTLNAILSEKRSPAQTPAPIDDEPPLQRIQSNRTLLDIIREEQSPGLGGGGRSSWRQLREKIGLGSRVGSGGGSSVWSSAVPVPASDVPINNHHHNYNNRTVMMMTRRPSTRFDPTIDSAESTHLDPGANGRLENNNLSRRRSIGGEDNRLLHDEERGGAAVGEEEQPVRMSLMALLAENDRQMGLNGSAYLMDDDGDQGEVGEGESVSGASGGGAYNNCCVCMVRHKGAAFIPCGHTFCRLCCRELWVQRGNCPLCNNYILEILDIF